MFKVSIIEGSSERRLVLEGKLIAPWVAELRPACEQAKVNLNGRELVVEVKNLTAINQAGENVLLELMNERVQCRGSGVFSKQVLRNLARRAHPRLEEAEVVTFPPLPSQPSV